jgi:hypothetical protein
VDGSANEFAAAQRARWLAELAESIDQAQRVAWRIGLEDGNNAEARELYARLEAARVEVDALRRGAWSRGPVELSPQWMKSFFGSSGAADSLD